MNAWNEQVLARIAGCSLSLAHNEKSFATRMLCEVRARQVSRSFRWCTFPAKNSLYGCCILPRRRNILPSRRYKSDTVASSLDYSQPELSENELHRRLNKAVGLINTADLLAPFDRSSYSAPLVIWLAMLRRIQAIPVDTHRL